MTTTSAAPVQVGDVRLEQVRADSLTFLENMAREHGDLFTYRVAGDDVVVANHPSLIGTVLRHDVHSYTKEHTPDHLMLGGLLGEGLLTTSGDVWRRQRSAIAPLFRRTEVLRYDALIVRSAAHLADRWTTSPGARRVDHDLSALTLAVLVEAIFGADVSSIGGGFGSAVDDINHYLGAYGQADEESNVLLSQRYARASRLVRAITDALIASFQGGGADASAFLQRLQAVQDGRQLHDQVLTLVMAGHETTAKLLSWALLLLAADPDAQRAVRAEVRRATRGGPLLAEHLPELELTGSVVREAMRLFPPIWLMSRRTVGETVLGDARLAPGTLVCISQWLAHRDERWWTDASSFRADRMTGGLTPAPFSYFPFGGGERLCIGQHLALLESTLGLATLVDRCAFARDGDLPSPQALVTLRPADGAELRVEPAPRVGADA